MAGIPDADFEETAPGSSALVITRLVCSLRGLQQEVLLSPGSRAFKAYGGDRATERFLCNFGLNESYHDRLLGRGLEVTGVDAEGKVRIVERPSHPFFMATLFVPQMSSEPGRPHPLIVAFVEAAAVRSGAAWTGG